MMTGGAETMLVDIVNQQSKTNQVVLLVINDKVNEELIGSIDRNVKIYRLGRKEGNKWQLLSSFFTIGRILNTEKPDVIHCHDNKLYPFFVRWRRKTCLTVHGTNLSMLFVKWFAERFAISESVRKDIKNRTGKDTEVIYNGIELEKYRIKTDYTFHSGDEFKVIQIGRLKPKIKGQHISILAMKMFLEKYQDVKAKLYLVGGGDGQQALEDLACGENTVFCGEKDRAWIQNHLKDYHLLIQPSLYEGFGLTVIEGFAAGLPVIASNVDGPKEILDSLDAGLSAEADDVGDLARKIGFVYKRYLSDEILNTNCLLADRTKLEVFDINITAKKYLEKYNQMNMKKTNILITAPSLDARINVSGISSMVKTIIEHNTEPEYHHFHFGRKDANPGKIMPILHTLRQLIIFPFALMRYKTDLVHQNFPFDPKGILRESVTRLWCRLFRIPVVLHVHGGKFLTGETPGSIYRFLSKKLFQGSRIVVVLSDLEKEVICKEYGCKNVCVLENCIDCAQFNFSSRTIPAIPTFIFIGRIHESKGLCEILEVFELMEGDHIPFRFILCGDGSLRETIVPKFSALLGDRFEYRGIVYGQEKVDAIREADFFLLPSWFEGMPVALLETMAAGVTPVITCVGSVGRLVHHGENGILIEKHNVPDMYEKIKYLLAHPATWATFSQNARQSVERDYDIGAYVSRLNIIYAQALRNP
jgi:glycosyltransferase involved in cell wall biosynthesis